MSADALSNTRLARLRGSLGASARTLHPFLVPQGPWDEAGRLHREAFARDVRAGLLADEKSLPCRHLYDDAGSALFEEICSVPEYYIPAAERAVLTERADEIAAAVPAGSDVVELGSGSATKTRLLLEAFLRREGRARYVPIDISRAALDGSARDLRAEYPALVVDPVLGEYEDGVAQLRVARARPKLVLWLGSNIGNMHRPEAAGFVKRLAGALAPRDRLLLGIDLRKDRETLELAYDDPAGVTRRFNRNILVRINRELGGRFDVERFRYRAKYHPVEGRVKMDLVSERDARVVIDGLGIEVDLAANEAIHTEDSYKYSLAEIRDLAAAAGLRPERQWIDALGLFSVNLFAPLG